MQKLAAAANAASLDREAIFDLNYEEDKLVTVDFNLVVTEDGEFVEVQDSGLRVRNWTKCSLSHEKASPH